MTPPPKIMTSGELKIIGRVHNEADVETESGQTV